MGELASNSRAVSINYQPLRASVSIVVVSSVPDRQSYSALTKEFTPDYTLTPLVLKPCCNAIDREKPIQPGEKPKYVNAELTNVHWFEIIDGVRKEIINSTEYQIIASGDDNGQLVIKKNSSIAFPVTYEFHADFLDTRTNHVLKFFGSKVVTVSDETEPSVLLELDCPNTILWNPLREASKRKVTAKMIVGNINISTDARTKFFWYRKLEDGSLEAITDGNGDNDWEIDAIAKNEITIDQEFIGNGNSYVCYGVYRKDGKFPTAPEEGDPVQVFSIQRRIPKLECLYKGVPDHVPDKTSTIFPKAVIRDSQGILPNSINEWVKCVWKVRKPGASTATAVAEGFAPKIAFQNGMILELSVEDRGPQVMVVDDTDPNIYCTDEDGTPLYTREF